MLAFGVVINRLYAGGASQKFGPEDIEGFLAEGMTRRTWRTSPAMCDGRRHDLNQSLPVESSARTSEAWMRMTFKSQDDHTYV